VPDNGLDYRPDPTSRSARDLVGHLLGHNLDLIEMIDDSVIHHRNQEAFESTAAAAKAFDESFGTLLAKLNEMSDAQWAKPTKFLAGDYLIMEAPQENLAWLLFLDSVHHRGQLSAYLRPMGSKVPSIYGPSADDQGPGH